MKSIMSSKIQIRESNLNGKGSFAKENIKKGEMVYIRGGELMRIEEAYNYKQGEIPDGIWPVNNEWWLGARNEEDFFNIKVYINHSCNPNCGLNGEITVVAIRDIKKGEEITLDYCFLDDLEYKLECQCKSPNCRKIITGKDWRIKELQDKYFECFSPYLKDKIINQQKNSH